MFIYRCTCFSLHLIADAAQRVSAGIAVKAAAVRVSVRAVTDPRVRAPRTNASAPKTVGPQRQSAPNAVSWTNICHFPLLVIICNNKVSIPLLV